MGRLTDEQLREIRKRADAADQYDRRYIEKVTDPHTAPLLFHARQDVPDLLAEIERLRKVAQEILEDYDDAKRRVIDEVVGSGRELVISFHEFLIKSYKNEINGVDDNGSDI